MKDAPEEHLPAETLRILVCSPIHQKPEILKEFLEALSCLEYDGFVADFFFYDDNSDPESKKLLLDFKTAYPSTIIKDSGRSKTYLCDETTHHWDEGLIWRVARFKDEMLSYALENDYDHVFLIDSDILLEPSTLSKLLSDGKDIVSAVFWTCWYPGASPLPNVWMYDHYDMIPKDRDEKLTEEEGLRRLEVFLESLRKPGIREVGMLGACTLLSRKAVSAGLSFMPVSNISMWGEDRHFCIRASVLGFKLYADSSCKTFHIYRQSDLSKAKAFRSEAGLEPSPLKLEIYRDIKCPICGASTIKLFNDSGSFKLLECKSCGLKFQHKAYTGDAEQLINDVYGPSWVQMRDQYSRDTFLEHAKFNNMLLEIFRPLKGRLLEIGSGTGEFLYMAKEAGWAVVGIEPGADACRYAQEKFGLELMCEMWNGRFKECFDAVVFWHVLEHMHAPAEFLISAAAALKPGGLLFFSLPNNDSLSCELYGTDSPLYSEADHIMHYNRRNLSLLLDKAGLSVVAMFTRQEPQGLEELYRLSNESVPAIDKVMALSARLQAGCRGYELVCIARCHNHCQRA